MLNKYSDDVTPLKSPYPTVVKVVVTQYKEAMYLSVGSSRKLAPAVTIHPVD